MYLLGPSPAGRPWYQDFEISDGFSNFKYIRESGQLRKSIVLKVPDTSTLSDTDVVNLMLEKRFNKVKFEDIKNKFRNAGNNLLILFSNNFYKLWQN